MGTGSIRRVLIAVWNRTVLRALPHRRGGSEPWGSMFDTEASAGNASAARTGLTRRITLPTLATIAVVAGVLHFGAAVFLPLAIATLISFALSPLVSVFRRRGIGRTLSVLLAVTIAFGILGAILFFMGGQLTLVIEQLPTFQSNIIAKLEALQAADGPSGVLGRFVDMLARINEEISSALPATDGSTGAAGNAEPMQVAVVETQDIWQVINDIILPIIAPIVTAGLVVVVVIFMLIERDDLRDRFIRLVGSNDLHRTTEILEDAGSRVAKYLLIQLLVNTIYAIPVGLGLWFIGVPNPGLWAMMTLVLRFVPYLGSIMAAAIPLFLAFAVSPDWSMVLWTVALFATVELVTSNVVEPWIYGSRTGLSPLAIIIAAIVWTSIWGPMGLILSTPLTVCLVVLGRYLPQFEVFDILFGDEPVLRAHTRLYQWLLIGDVVEATSRAEEELEESHLSDYYRDVGIPALLLAQADYDRGVLSEVQEERIALSAREFIAALEPVVADQLLLADAEGEVEPSPQTAVKALVSGGRSRLDDVAAGMFGQALAVDGADVTIVARGKLNHIVQSVPEAATAKVVILNFLDPTPARASLLIVRRLKRALPQLRVGVVIWQMPTGMTDDGSEQPRHPSVDAALRSAEEIGADFVATSMDDALRMALADDPPRLLEDDGRPRARRRTALRAAAPVRKEPLAAS
ncbi:MAG: AI-2E family transporter [Tabrizicola sp.]|uniref:AI-2E family transporter n=1 Tax=Tabrizicola sp. TaxID=2005166 RepID=UPI002736BD42|nr:AI-2E family transporter [Tabrizicola sp.]MDP3264678.1 AI-2E family transporter [Tabrizicola sp.]MDP3649873.1 AI-2E family transporter [Paracoccaceae bacterium]